MFSHSITNFFLYVELISFIYVELINAAYSPRCLEKNELNI